MSLREWNPSFCLHLRNLQLGFEDGNSTTITNTNHLEIYCAKNLRLHPHPFPKKVPKVHLAITHLFETFIYWHCHSKRSTCDQSSTYLSRIVNAFENSLFTFPCPPALCFIQEKFEDTLNLFGTLDHHDWASMNSYVIV